MEAVLVQSISLVKTLRLLLACSFASTSLLPAQQVKADFRDQVEQVIEDFNAKKYDSAIARIDGIKAEGEDEAFLLNLRGAAYTKKKDYAEAKRCFEKTLQLVPGMFAAQFNLGEIEFLQGNYQKALDTFKVMLDNDPRNELLQFKVFLCYLQMGDVDAAKKALNKVKFPGDTPAYYYAQAAWEYKQGDKGKVSDYLSGARYIFAGKTELFDETFADLEFPRK